MPKYVYLVIAMSAACASAFGQLVNYASDLEVRHRTNKGKIDVEFKGRKQTAAPDQTIKLKAKPGEEVRIVVKDPNTLLFGYKLGERTETNNPSFDAFNTFREIILPDLPKVVGNQALAIKSTQKPDDVEISVGGRTISYNELKGSLKIVNDMFAEIQNKVDATIVGQPDPNYPTSPQQTALDYVGKFTDMLREIEAASIEDKPIFRLQHSDVSPTNVLLRPSQLFNAQAELDALAANAPMPRRAEVEAKARLASLYRALTTLENRYKAVATFVTDYKAYRATVTTGLHLGSVSAKNDKDITQPFEFNAKAGYDKSKTATDHQKDAGGKYSLFVEPAASIHLRGGLGVVYSFVRNPEFSAATQADGTIKIAEKESSSDELSAAGTLNFYPDRYWGEQVEPFLQIGYSPAKDVQGILLGAGATFFGKWQISGGAIYQQRRTLKTGQSVGMTIPRAEDLAVDKEWTTGIYVQVSVALPFTK